MKRISLRRVRRGLTLKVLKKDGTVYKYARRSKRAFFAGVRSFPAQNARKYFLRVYYGKGETAWGKNQELLNEGEYSTKKDLLFALRCFTERGLLDDIADWLARKEMK